MRWFIALACVFAALPAAAQSTYVGASLVGDIAKFGTFETAEAFRFQPEPDSSLDGESLGFGATIGRALGERWGVELEFVRSGAMERRSTSRFGPTLPPTTIPAIPGIIPIPIPIPNPIPSFEFEIRTELQHTTMTAMAWVRHDVGDRMELSYLGGISFIRSELERELGVADSRFSILLPIGAETSVTEYQAGPAIGLDASFKFGDHAALVTGVRMHALSAESRRGWLIRPGAGLRWRF